MGEVSGTPASKISDRFFCSQFDVIFNPFLFSSRRKLKSADFGSERFAEMPHNLISFLKESAGDVVSAFNLAERGHAGKA